MSSFTAIFPLEISFIESVSLFNGVVKKIEYPNDISIIIRTIAHIAKITFLVTALDIDCIFLVE